MGIIANLDINLRGNTQDLDKKLDSSSKSIEKFGNKTSAVLGFIKAGYSKLTGFVSSYLQSLPGGGALDKAFGSLQSALGGLLTVGKGVGQTLLGAFTNPAMAIKGLITLGTGLLDVLTSIWDVAKNLVIAFVQMGMSAIPKIAANKKEADKLGISYGSLATLAYKAKMSADEMTPALQKLQKSFVQPTEEASRAFAILGVKGQELANMPLEDAIGKLGDGFAKVGNNATRTALMMDIAGKSGANIFRIYEGGSEAMKKAAQDTKELGLQLEAYETARVGKAKGAMSTLKKAWEGLANTAAVTIAPLVEYIAKTVTEGVKWFNKFRPALEELTLYWRFILDNIADYGKLKWEQMLSGIEKFVRNSAAWFKTWYDAITEWFEKGAIFGQETFNDMFERLNEQNRQALKTDWATNLEASLKRREEQFNKRWFEFKAKEEAASETKTGQALNLSSSKQKTENKAATYGSEEAFRIIADQQGDKMLSGINKAVANLEEIKRQLQQANRRRPQIVEAGTF